MKLSLNKLISLAIFVPAFILFGLSGFFFYKNFHNYQQVKSSQKYVELTKRLENILVALGEERGTSSIYFVSKGQYPKSKALVMKKRAKMSRAINELKSFINQNPKYYNDVKNILSLTNELPTIRKRIDSFSNIKYKEWFFGYYTRLENQIINKIYSLSNKFPATLQTLYKTKIPFEKATAYTGIIRGFGSYYITADLPINENDYKNVLMKYYHDTNILPLASFKNTPIGNEFNSNKFKNLESDIKAILFYIEQADMEYYQTGNFNGYPIDSIDYFNELTKRIKYFKDASSYINNEINENIKNIKAQATNNLIIYSILFIISILILLAGLYIHKLVNNHIKELSELISSLAPITGKEEKIDVASPEGMHKAIQTVSEAIKITQESVKHSEEAAKAKSLFLANMSHEIRTPLNGILGFLELLKTTEPNEEQQEYISTIELSAKNLLQIVNNILDVSKIESQKITLEEIEFRALDEFENTIEIFATPAAQKNIEYVADISPDIPSVLKGDILKIKEILTNLINNAMKFTHQDGQILVTIKNNGIKENSAELYFEVKDTGIGMSEEQKNKIFEAFTQADESVTRKYGGTGLGLTIVKSYIEMMGGQIQVESEINKGTKFFFTLNLEVLDKTPRYEKSLFSDKTFAILNTQKDSTRKEITFNYYSYFGINRIGFNNTSELINLLNKEKIDAVAIFYQESNKNEIEALFDKELNIPIIMISSFAFKENIDKLSPNINIYDPVTPTKIVTSTESLKEKIILTKKEKAEETPIYKIKALVAEDNPINMKLITTMFKNLGVEVDTANNGLEAFNKYSMYPDKYDVIFMDVQMPVMDGIEATQEILEFEKEEGLPHTPIIAVTANVLKGDKERFLGSGMDDYISKPIEKEELHRVLEEIAKHRYSRKTHKNEVSNKENKEETKEINKIENNEPKNDEIKTSIENTENNNEMENKDIPIQKTPIKENIKEKKLILASESSFLAKYLKNILKEDFDIATNIKELSKLAKKDNFNIILIEEDFAGADLEQLISSIKEENPDTIIIAITEKDLKNADAVISDLNPEEIEKIIQKVNK